MLRMAVLRRKIPATVPDLIRAWHTFGHWLDTAEWTSDGCGPGARHSPG